MHALSTRSRATAEGLKKSFTQIAAPLQAESDVPPFHYGSHYSAAGVVLFYLIRLEPFTRLNRTLQV